MNRTSWLEKRLSHVPENDKYPLAQPEFPVLSNEELENLNRNIRERLNKAFGEEIYIKRNDEEFRQLMQKTIEALLEQENVPLSSLEKNRFVTDLINDILGFGPIQPFVDDDTVTEIMVVGPDKVFVERNGRLEPTGVRFLNKRQVELLIDKIIGPLGRRCDESSPNVDARLPDGSRVSASVTPIALDGPYITIRKFRKKIFTLEEYIQIGSMDERMAEFIRAAVQARLNIICSGGTGSGKTSLLNCISAHIDPSERIITIEDSAELKLTQPHVERYEAKPPNVEGKGAITIRDLVIYSLRKRPDRIIVGEIRGGEALDMLQAMNTGHEGSLTTGHANTPKDLINRLVTMALMSGIELPHKVIREMIAGGIQLIIHTSRLKGGVRKVTSITEVVGMGREAAEKLGLKKYDKETVYLKDIFRFVETGVDENGRQLGYFVATGHVPFFMDRFKALGVEIDESIFRPDSMNPMTLTDNMEV